MTSPNNAYVGGALDLSQVKARAEARQKAQESPQPSAGGVQPFFTVTESNFDQRCGSPVYGSSGRGPHRYCSLHPVGAVED